MQVLLLACVYFVVNNGVSTSNPPPKNDNEIRDMLSGLLKDYDVKLRPNYLGEPVEVTVDTTVLSISNIDEVGISILIPG